MSTTRLSDLKSPPKPLESKIHPAIVAFEKFYQSQTLIEAAELFIKKDIQGELNFTIRRPNLLPEEHKALSEWAYQEYGHYIEAEKEHSLGLTPRERTWLGAMHAIGIGVPQNTEKAKLIHQQAAQEGDGYAYFLLGTAEKDSALQEPLFLEAIKRECSPALDNLAFSRESKNPEQALADYKRAAELGVSNAMRNLSLCFRLGELNIPIDFQQAYNYSMMSAATGCPQALSDLANMYYSGTPVTPVNFDTAQQLHEAALKRSPNTKTTQYNLGTLAGEKNPGQAALHYRCALKLGHAPSQQLLWTLFQANKTDPRVCFHAAIAFQIDGTEEQKSATCTEFNGLPKTHLDIFNDLSSKEENPETVLTLLEMNENKIIEFLRILFNVLNDNDFLIRDNIPIVLAYIYPLKVLTDKIINEELITCRWLKTQKNFSETDMITIFGAKAKNHLTIIKAAEESETSYLTAKTKILGR